MYAHQYTGFKGAQFQRPTPHYRRYIKTAPSNAERTRGYVSISYIELRRGNVKAAQTAAMQVTEALRYDEAATGMHYLLSLHKNDLGTAAKLGSALEKMPTYDRGARGSLRGFCAASTR